jgi:hypothetical protein
LINFDEIRRIIVDDPALMRTFTAAPEAELFAATIALGHSRGLEITVEELKQIVDANRRESLERWLMAGPADSAPEPDNAPANKTGWIPARLKVIGGEAFIDWSWLGYTRFAQPFFDSTIQAAQSSPFNALFTYRTPIAALGAWYNLSPGLAPDGFIFHMSRCGSTLVSQMLASMPGAVVISEAGPLDWLARASAIPEISRGDWFRWMAGALGQKRSGNETRYFIKFDSITTVALPFIRRVFPTVPWIFLYRDPEEVLVSHMREPAIAMTPGFINDVSVIAASADITHEDYAARVIGKLCEHAAREIGETGLAVNYTHLPEAVHGRIASHFNLDISAEDLARMTALVTQHSKHPRREFQPDSDSKRAEASAALREAATRWISPHYEKLATDTGDMRRQPRWPEAE